MALVEISKYMSMGPHPQLDEINTFIISVSDEAQSLEEANELIRELQRQLEDQDKKIASLMEGGRKQEAEVRQKKPYLDCGMCQIMLKYNNKLLN